MEFSDQVPGVSECMGNNDFYVKREPEDEDNFAVDNNYDLSTNEEFTEEKPFIADAIQNTAFVEIKEENPVDFSSASAQDFVFVACVEDAVKFEDQNENAIGTNALNTYTRQQKKSDGPCQYCGRVFMALEAHIPACESKFVYQCTLCSSILARKRNIKRHIQSQHSLDSLGVEKVNREIVANGIELNVSTAEEKQKLIYDMTTRSRAKTNTESHQQTIVPKINQNSTVITATEQQAPNVIYMIIAPEFNVPTVINIQNSIVSDVAKSTGQTSQKSDAPFVKINLPAVNDIMQYRSIIAKDTTVAGPNANRELERKIDVSTQIDKESEDPLKDIHCNECSFKTLSKVDLSSHITTRHPLISMTFECTKCGQKFERLGDFNVHKTNCNVKTFYHCLFCKKILLLKSNILTHIWQQHIKEVADKEPLEVTRLVEAKKKIVDLSIVYQNAELLKNSAIRKQANKQKLKEFAASKAKKLVDSNTNEKPNVPSVISDEIIKRPVASNTQQVQETQKPNYNFCNECTFKTSSKAILQRHIMKQHSEKLNLRLYNCYKCEKPFHNLKDLTTHELACTIRLYHSCPFCKKVVQLKKSILKHISKKHSKEVKNKKPDEINSLIQASRKSIDTSTLDSQAKKSFSSPQYIFCDHCHFRVLKKEILVRHIMKNHSAELNLTVNPNREIRCPKCQTRVKGTNIEAHSYVCHEKYNYACTFCPKVYLSMNKVEQHVLQQHSTELADQPIDELTREIYSKRTTRDGQTKRVRYPSDEPGCNKKERHPSDKPDKTDASTSEEFAIVYCVKCKSVKTQRGKVYKNNCRDCGARVIYVCSKCKNVHALEFYDLKNHLKQCTEDNEISQDYLDKLILHSCSECAFTSTHKFKFNMHIARSKHKVAGAKSVKEDKNKKATDDLASYDESKFAIRPCVVDFATMTNRYCPKCDKVITDEMQERKPITEGSCQLCKAPFVPQCVKCNTKCKKWLTMRYHLNTKCFPGDYLCIKCNHHTTSWQLMQKHYVIHHTNRCVPFLCEFCSFRSAHRTNFNFHLKRMHPDKTEHIVFKREYFTVKRDVDFMCDHCSFKSKHKYSLKVHLQTVHSTKRHKCKLCKFKTRYEANLKRHVTTRHRNCY